MEKQLFMYLESLDNLPKIPLLDEGYEIRILRKGEEVLWEELISCVFDSKVSFKEAFDDKFIPERIFLVTFNDKIIGAAAGWHRDIYGDEGGYLHYVAVCPEHRGKQLGRILTIRALYKMKEEGRKAAFLTTDDFRIPAIKVYLDLGFKPSITHGSHIERWKKIYKSINYEWIR